VVGFAIMFAGAAAAMWWPKSAPVAQSKVTPALRIEQHAAAERPAPAAVVQKSAVVASETPSVADEARTPSLPASTPARPEKSHAPPRRSADSKRAEARPAPRKQSAPRVEETQAISDKQKVELEEEKVWRIIRGTPAEQQNGKQSE
jgi:hypothetical protein